MVGGIGKLGTPRYVQEIVVRVKKDETRGNGRQVPVQVGKGAPLEEAKFGKAKDADPDYPPTLRPLRRGRQYKCSTLDTPGTLNWVYLETFNERKKLPSRKRKLDDLPPTWHDLVFNSTSQYIPQDRISDDKNYDASTSKTVRFTPPRPHPIQRVLPWGAWPIPLRLHDDGLRFYRQSPAGKGTCDEGILHDNCLRGPLHFDRIDHDPVRVLLPTASGWVPQDAASPFSSALAIEKGANGDPKGSDGSRTPVEVKGGLYDSWMVPEPVKDTVRRVWARSRRRLSFTTTHREQEKVGKEIVVDEIRRSQKKACETRKGKRKETTAVGDGLLEVSGLEPIADSSLDCGTPSPSEDAGEMSPLLESCLGRECEGLVDAVLHVILRGCLPKQSGSATAANHLCGPIDAIGRGWQDVLGLMQDCTAAAAAASEKGTGKDRGKDQNSVVVVNDCLPALPITGDVLERVYSRVIDHVVDLSGTLGGKTVGVSVNPY